jgi:hypothetical protein
VNTVTLGIFKSLPAPQNQNFATLMIAIVLAIPVLLWVLIGHVVAPIFVQRVVIRGGAVIQGFAGTVFSAVGASSMAIFSGGLAGSASLLGNMTRNSGRDDRDARPFDYAPSQGREDFFAEPLDAFVGDQIESGAQSPVPSFRGAKAQEQATRGLSGLGAGMMGAGAAMMNRFGSVARFIGHAVVEGSGEGSGLEYRALAAFGPGGRTRPSPNQRTLHPSAEIYRRSLANASRRDESEGGKRTTGEAGGHRGSHRLGREGSTDGWLQTSN